MSVSEYKKGEEVELTKHFKSTEFDCHCKNKSCTITYIDSDLIDLLEQLRNKWEKPIKIVSGFRCVAHNAKVGGKSGSQHLLGKACDFDISSLKNSIGIGTLVNDCQVFNGLGVSIKDNFIHVDVRGYHARWTY